MDYNMLVPYVRSKVRVIKLKRPTGHVSYGFAIRGGREHGIGIFVSEVGEESVAHMQGLRVGDQIVQVNGLKIDEAIHEEVLNLLKTGTNLELKVKSVGMIPVKKTRSDTLSWQVVDFDSPTSPTIKTFSSNSSRSGDFQEVTVYLTVPPNQRFGCNICKGPSERPGIFIQSIREGGLASEVGLRAGDQIMEANGKDLMSMEFTEAVNYLKNSKEVELLIRKGAGVELFPNDTSGYNSSNSSMQDESLAAIRRPSIQLSRPTSRQSRPSSQQSPATVVDSSHTLHHSGDQETGELHAQSPLSSSPLVPLAEDVLGDDAETDRDAASEVTVEATVLSEKTDERIQEEEATVAPPPVVNATVVVINSEPVYAKVDPERKRSTETDRDARRRQMALKARQHREEERQVVQAALTSSPVSPSASWPTEETDEQAEKRRQLEYVAKLEEQKLEMEVEERLTTPGAPNRRTSLLFPSDKPLPEEQSEMERTEKMVRIAEAQVERNISRSSSNSSSGSGNVAPPPALAEKWQKTVLAEIHNTPKPSVGLADQNGHDPAAAAETSRRISCEPSIPVNAEVQKRNQHALKERDRLSIGTTPNVDALPARYKKKSLPNITPVILTGGQGWQPQQPTTPLGTYSTVRRNSLVPIIPPNIAPHKFLDPEPKNSVIAESPTSDSAPGTPRLSPSPLKFNNIFENNNGVNQQPTSPRTPTPIRNKNIKTSNITIIEAATTNNNNRAITDSALPVPKPPEYFFKPKAKVNVIVGSYADMINKSGPNRLEYLKQHPSVEIEMITNGTAEPISATVIKPPPQPAATWVKQIPSTATSAAITTPTESKSTKPPLKKITPPVSSVTVANRSVTKVTVNQSPPAQPTTAETSRQAATVIKNSNSSSSTFQEARALFGAQLRSTSSQGSNGNSQPDGGVGGAAVNRRQRPPVSSDNRLAVQVPAERAIVIE